MGLAEVQPVERFYSRCPGAIEQMCPLHGEAG